MSKDKSKSNEIEIEEILDDEVVNEETETGDASEEEIEVEAEEVEETPESDEEAEETPEPEEEEEEIDPIEAAAIKVKEANDKYLRLMAEFDNFKKRTANEYGKMIQSANKNMMDDLITVRESFARALSSDEENHDAEAFFEGMKMIFSNFDDNLTKHGLDSFAEVGEKFDPALHDAMMKQPNDEIPADHIVQVFERGYKLKDSIIRHAKVIVSEG